MAAKFTPENVAKGLRDYFAWETSFKPSVEIYEMFDGSYDARVTVTAAAQTDTIEQTLRAILPPGYTLKMTWTDA